MTTTPTAPIMTDAAAVMIVNSRPLPEPPIDITVEPFVLAYVPEADVLSWPWAETLAIDRTSRAADGFVIDIPPITMV